MTVRAPRGDSNEDMISYRKLWRNRALVKCWKFKMKWNASASASLKGRASAFEHLIHRLLYRQFRSWKLELETSSAPLQLHPQLLRRYISFKSRTELDWPGKLNSSAPAPLQRNFWFLIEKKFAIVAYTCTGFLMVFAIQQVDKMLNQRDISHQILTGDPLSSC